MTDIFLAPDASRQTPHTESSQNNSEMKTRPQKLEIIIGPIIPIAYAESNLHFVYSADLQVIRI